MGIFFLSKVLGEFPGGLSVRTRFFHCHGPGSSPGQGTKILQAVQHGRKIDLPDPGVEPMYLRCLALEGEFFTTSAMGSPNNNNKVYKIFKPIL